MFKFFRCAGLLCLKCAHNKSILGSSSFGSLLELRAIQLCPCGTARYRSKIFEAFVTVHADEIERLRRTLNMIVKTPLFKIKLKRHTHKKY